MPLARISLKSGKPDSYKTALFDAVYAALRATFNVPDEDRFMVLSEHDTASFTFSRSYLGIARSDDLVIIELTVSNTRTVQQKQALYRDIVDRLGISPGVRPEDVIIILTEVGTENWSFGNGIASYVPATVVPVAQAQTDAEA